MRNLLFIVLLVCPLITRADDNSDYSDPFHLVVYGETNRLESLLKSGYDINAPIADSYFSSDDNRSAIFFAARPEMLAYLIRNGADPHHLSSSGEIPIDYAFSLARNNVVEWLAKNFPYTNEETISGYPIRLLHCVFGETVCNKNTIAFVAVNGEEPSFELMQWLKGEAAEVIPVSYDYDRRVYRENSIEYSADAWKAKLQKMYGTQNVERIFARMNKEDETNWVYSVSCNRGPLSGFFKEGRYSYHGGYKHWILTRTGGGQM